MATENRGASWRGNSVVLTVFLVVAALRLASEVFLPIALAILFSFLLSPFVSIFRRWRLGRIPSVFLAVLIALVVLGSLGMFLAGQFSDLTKKLPEYQQNIEQKWHSIVQASGGLLARIAGSTEQIKKEIAAPAQNKQPNHESNHEQRQSQKPTPVEVQNTVLSPLSLMKTVLGSVFSALVMLFIVVVFLIFMLIEQDDLRARLTRLIGGEPGKTSELLNEASGRVSTYLLMQLIVNVTYAIPIAVGLYFIGIPNPILWGALAGMLRYIPYIGPWIAMALPALLALAVEPGWAKPLMVFGLFGVVELIVANAVEPWLYGSSTGITPLAVLMAAVFWTWLWGPLGLLLSTPLTVCFVTIGRYLPSMKFLDILFGDEPKGRRAKKNQSSDKAGSSSP